jgi:hypothetical protein
VLHLAAIQCAADRNDVLHLAAIQRAADRNDVLHLTAIQCTADCNFSLLTVMFIIQHVYLMS